MCISECIPLCKDLQAKNISQVYYKGKYKAELEVFQVIFCKKQN